MSEAAGFLALALRREVLLTACKVALLVGTILALINHGPAITQGELDSGRILQIALTYLVPYCVSTYSAVRALQRQLSSHPME